MVYEYDKKNFNKDQQLRIAFAVQENIDEKVLDLMATVDKNGYPVFNESQMYEIHEGYKSNLTVEEIKIYARLDKNMNAIFDDQQMYEIRYLLEEKYPKYMVDIMIKTNNDIPVFIAEEMIAISDFLDTSGEKEIKQLREFVDYGSNFNKIKPFIDHKVSARCMRVLHSMYELGLNCSCISFFIESRYNYEELKEIKSLLKYDYFFNLNVPIDCNAFTVDNLRENVISGTLKSFSVNKDYAPIIATCICFKMPPEQIRFLVKSSFSVEETKNIALALLNGASFERLKSGLITAEDVLNSDDTNISFESFDEIEFEL